MQLVLLPTVLGLLANEFFKKQVGAVGECHLSSGPNFGNRQQQLLDRRMRRNCAAALPPPAVPALLAIDAPPPLRAHPPARRWTSCGR